MLELPEAGWDKEWNLYGHKKRGFPAESLMSDFDLQIVRRHICVF